MSSMSFRRSETVLRLLIALAFGVGFVGFATRGHAATHTSQLLQVDVGAQQAHSPS
jgi:hypothetical protein